MHETYKSLLQTSSILELLQEFNTEAENVLNHLAQLETECAIDQSSMLEHN